MATIETVTTPGDAEKLDVLLWRILWRPLGFPRDIRHNFTVDGEELELAAKENGRIIGGLVAIWTNDSEVELRHLAVASEAQQNGIGQSLVAELSRIVTLKDCRKIHTIVRNTSAGFFRQLGFRNVPGKAPEHPVFLKHGITFELMDKCVEQSGK